MKFADLLDDISFIRDSTNPVGGQSLPFQGDIQTSIIMETDSANTVSQAQSSTNQQKLFSDEGEAYSYKSSKSN